jgi:RHS repeat-associated protein
VPNRHGSTPAYRYGFNGKEKDDELKGEGNSINYEARMQDTRIGRFLSVDPLTKTFPHYSPYQFAGNTPIQAIDLDGAEEYHYLAKWDKESGKIVFKLESDKTVHKKSFLGYTWIPTEEHIVVYQNSDGETTNYEFPKGGKLIQYGPTSIAERINTPASLRKFASDAKKITYQDEESATKALDTNFLSNGAENAFTAGNAMITYSNFYTPITKTPVEKNAPNITALRNMAVKKAWKQEKVMIESTGRGTRDWTKSEMKEIITTGTVKGYAGHHINDVKNYPKLAGNPDNIEFLQTGNTKSGGAKKGSEHYLRHNTSDGKKIETSSGALIKRTGD